jgi:PKD repeat protein
MPKPHSAKFTSSPASEAPDLPPSTAGLSSLSKRVAAIVFLAAISLIVGISACDDLITEQVTIVVVGNPTAEFTVDVDSGCAPLTVNFLDKSSGPHDQWLWKFGDGDSSTDTTPTHTYTSPGTYNVSLKITDNDTVPSATDSEFKKRFIIVGSSIAGFTMDTSGGCPGASITFTPTFSGATSFNWDFGDGATSTDTFPTHTFDTLGDFPITLSVVGGCGVDSAFDTVSIGVCPTFVLTVDSATLCLGSPVRFTASPNDTVPRLLHTWDFGDGFVISDTLPSISYIYNDTGVFTVKLTVLNTDSVSFTDSAVNIVQIFDTLVASFVTSSPTFACETPTGQFAVLFTDMSRGVITSRIWDFGDGTFDSTNNPAPIHAYVTPGQFDVSLQIFGPCGINPSDTITKPELVTLSGALTAGITFTQPANDSFIFMDNSLGVPSSWEWDFGDGTTGVGDSVDHGYTVVNPAVDTTFIVSLKVKNLSCSLDSSIAVETVLVVSQ